MESRIFNLLALLIISSYSIYAQHRIKQSEALSVYAEVVRLSETNVTYRFYRQTQEYILPRSSVSSIEALVWDPFLIIENFKMINPYKLEKLYLDDEVRFKDYRKYNGLNYRKIDAKVLEIKEDSIHYLTVVDGQYLLEKVATIEIESIAYSEVAMAYLMNDSLDLDFRDRIVGVDGVATLGYVYALDYQGVKYSTRILNNIDFEVDESGKLKMKNIQGMEFISYNDIKEINLANGQRMVTRFYKNKPKTPRKNLKRYPKATLKIGSGYGIRTNSSGAVYSTITDVGRRILTQKEGNFDRLVELARVSLVVQVSEHIDITGYYGFLRSSSVSYITEEYFTDLEEPVDYFTTAEDSYKLRLHKMGVSLGYTLGNIRIGAGPNVVQTANLFSGEGYFFVNGGRYARYTYSRVYKSKPYLGWDASLSYNINIGRVNLVPSLSYTAFRIDHFDSKKNESASGVAFIRTDNGTNSGSRPTYTFRQNVAPVVNNWEMVVLRLEIAYSF